jgi:hypothetical protein
MLKFDYEGSHMVNDREEVKVQMCIMLLLYIFIMHYLKKAIRTPTSDRVLSN